MNEIFRGEIRFADLGEGIGSRQGMRRPVVIVSNEANNRFSPTVQVVPLTSRVDKQRLPMHVKVGLECGLIKESVALCEQETTIDKEALIYKIGECTTEVINKINTAIKIQKEIYSPFCINNFVNKFVTQYNIKNEKLAFVLQKELKKHCEKYNIDHMAEYSYN